MKEVPDPIAFVGDVLDSEGALVERYGNAVEALVPEEISRALGIGEHARFVLAAEQPGEVSCGLGSTVLERLVSAQRAQVSAHAFQVEMGAPRITQARSLAERFVVRNGVSSIGEARNATATYVSVVARYVAEADDRYEGLVRIVMDCSNGSVPELSFVDWLDRAELQGEAVDSRESCENVEYVASLLMPRIEDATRRAIAPTMESVARRHARDHARIVEYFEALLTEARSPRRRIEPAAIAAKCAQLTAERDAKLRDLQPRFSLRISVSVAAILWASVPVVQIEMHLRRRKESRDLWLQLPVAARALDAPRCEGCGLTTSKPALCDERLHLLCETCVPNVQGRPRCPACT